MRQFNEDGFAPQIAVSYTPAQPQAQMATVTPAFKLDLVRSVRMHRRLALGVAAAVFVLIAGYALTRRPMYQAESLTYVEPLATKVMNDGSPGFYDPSRYDSYLEQQIQTAQRNDILQAAIERLPEGVWRRPGESMPAAVARLSSALTVKRVGSSYQLSISATGSDAEGTAAVVNAVTDAYLEQGSRDEHAISAGRIQLLNEERQRLQTQLEQAQSEQTQLSGALGMANPVAKDAVNPYDTNLAGIRAELETARQAHDVAAAQLSSMGGQGGAQSPALAAAADELIASDAGLSAMRATMNQRRAALQSQMAGLTPSNPVYRQDDAEIASLDRDLEAMATQLRVKAEQRLQEKLRQELQRTGDVESRLNSELGHDTAMATSAAPKLQRASELGADIVRLQGSLAGVDDSLRALNLETHGPGLAHLSVAASVPSVPTASKKKLLLLLSLPLALMMGVAAAVVAHKRDPHAYIGEDVQAALGFSPMGLMPAPDEVSEGVMEEYLLRVAAGVERAYRVHGARSFVFTALGSGTEVGALVRDVQRKLVELGFAVLALDVDSLVRPAIRMDLDLRPDRERREGFATATLERMKSEHDLVLLEARPLLLSAETEYAICSTDAVVMVAESGVTTGVQLKEAAALLHRLGARGVAVVMQDVRLAYAEPHFRIAVSELQKNSEVLQWRRVRPAGVRDSRIAARESKSLEPEAGRDVVREEPTEAREFASAQEWNRDAAEREGGDAAEWVEPVQVWDEPARAEQAEDLQAGREEAAASAWAEPAEDWDSKEHIEALQRDEAEGWDWLKTVQVWEFPLQTANVSEDDAEEWAWAQPSQPVEFAWERDSAESDAAAKRVEAVEPDAAVTQALVEEHEAVNRVDERAWMPEEVQAPVEVEPAMAIEHEAVRGPVENTETNKVPTKWSESVEEIWFSEAPPAQLEPLHEAVFVERAAEGDGPQMAWRVSEPSATHEDFEQPVATAAEAWPLRQEAPRSEPVHAFEHGDMPARELPQQHEQETAREWVPEPETWAAAAVEVAEHREASAPVEVADAWQPTEALPSYGFAAEEVRVAAFVAQPVEERHVVEIPVVDPVARQVRDNAAAPLLRQWEFRQARRMREAAAAEAVARPVEEVSAPRVSSRPGLMSATGKRTSTDDKTAGGHGRAAAQAGVQAAGQSAGLAAGQPKPVKKWMETTEEASTAPARRWGVLSRYDRRFQQDAEAERNGAGEHDSEIPYGQPAAGHGPGNGAGDRSGPR